MKPINEKIFSGKARLAIPVLTFPGGQLTGDSVRTMVHSPAAQIRAQLALRDRFKTAALLSAMDLSTEAEEFGASIQFSENEVPTVTGRLVTDLSGAEQLPVPQVGARRSRVYLETVRGLARERAEGLVLAGLIGPFSLAGRLFGVSEALLATAMEPDAVKILLEKTTQFLTAYARAFKEAGADGVIMAEPTAGLLSPRAVTQFSSPYIKRIIEAVEDERFQLLLHNCGAKIGHLSAKRESGASALHFGKPMDLPAALKEVPPELPLCGNLDPAEVFVNSAPEAVAARTEELLAATAGFRNFAISSGCDIPAHAPLKNIETFFSTVAQWH